MSRGAVIFIAGRDTQRYLEDSHCIYVRIHARAATLAGYDVHILCLDRNARSEATTYGTVHALKTHFGKVRQNMMPLYSPILSRAAESLAMTLGPAPAIVHGFGVWGHAAVNVGKRLEEKGRRCASLVGSYTTHVDENESQWRGIVAADGLRVGAKAAFERTWSRSVISRYERHGYRNAGLILVNYRSVESMIRRRYGADLKCDVIPYTVESEFQRTQPTLPGVSTVRAGPPVIVSVAAHQPRKGVDVLLNALRAAKDSQCLFSAHLIGGGPLLDGHRRLLQRLQLSDCVTIHGLVPKVDDYLDNADIFVLPSREEQSGSLALLEALRAGVACIASGCDGIPEDVTHQRDAWLTVPGDAGSLTEGIVALIKDRSLRERLARAGRSTFERRFSGAAFAKVLDRVYRQSVGQSVLQHGGRKSEAGVQPPHVGHVGVG
jgi:glycosyltransferase involved in cell wall biosynthesis